MPEIDPESDARLIPDIAAEDPAVALERHKRASAQWLSKMRPFLWENWSPALKSLSFRTTTVEITKEEIQDIFPLYDGKPATDRVIEVSKRITAEIESNFGSDGCFAKLSSRSPKDSFPVVEADLMAASALGPEFYQNLPRKDVIRNHRKISIVHNGEQVLSNFVNSMRIADDLLDYLYAETPCFLLLREHREIPEYQEWRCFVNRNRVIGVSQYDYQKSYPEVTQAKGDVRDRVLDYLYGTVLDSLPFGKLVVDLWVGERPFVIEINPYGISDPCLLTYEELEAHTDARPIFRIVE